MCGISGIINFNCAAIGGIKLMNNLIRHRGPDGEGYFFLDDKKRIYSVGGSDTPEAVWESKLPYGPSEHINKMERFPFRLAFGHRRLSIIDLSASGHQPMSYANSRYWITYNGEIYNYKDIQRELIELGHIFFSSSDTEVILASYAEWGEKCLEKFSGMWAFAIYDSLENEIFLARDRYGIKPLYYWFSADNTFYFASEIKQFTVLPKWEARLNPQRTYDHLVYSISDHTDETMFDRVFQLPSGTHYKSLINQVKPGISGRINSVRWYRPVRNQYTGSFNDACRVFRDLFQKSVNEHLRADVQIGTALSGGLDSSAIVCEINRILRNKGQESLQKTFSSCSSYERFDERKWMDIIVKSANIDAHFVYPELEEAIKMTPDIVWHQDEPYQSQSAFLANNIFKLAKKNGVKVLLNGQGADEYLGGYGQFTIARYSKLAKQLRFGELLTEVRITKELYPKARDSVFAKIAYNFLPDQVKREVNSSFNRYNLVRSIIEPRKMHLTPAHPFDSIPVKYKSVPEISHHLTFFSTLPKYLHWEDRNSMNHSIEARVPFLDHRLVEFAHNLPDNFLEKNGVNKLIMREAFKNLIPEEILNRRDKMGYTTPEENWVKHEKPDYFRQKIAESIDISHGIIKDSALIYFDRVVDGTSPFDYTYWRIILFAEWINKFNIKI